MKLEYTDLSKSVKDKALEDYKGMDAYFAKAETEILRNPFDSVCETIIVEGKRVHKTYKKTIKTDIFSGRFPNSYLYLSLSYAETPDNSRLIVYGVYIRTYAP
ncbi:MAG: hypothetical protein LBD09_00275 [Treponema sp.]|jgi:hypothetical protein|nr:hypothetical protein [Treponema sp.]